MVNNTAHIDHIALYVTSLKRSMKFYQDILHMTIGEPISLKEQSKGLKYTHSLMTHGPKLVRDWISKNKPTTYQHMFTDICHCTSGNGTINLILVQETHPEKGYTRSVTGNTLYGFSFELSSTVDIDDLGWDMSIADISFEHGDIGTDGTIYSPTLSSHSIYIKDPDGRMIELFSPITKKEQEENFITKPGHIMLYVNDIQASLRFYQQTLGVKDITPDYIPRNPWGKNITWLGYQESRPVIILYQVTNPKGILEKAGGYGLDHFGLTGIKIESEQIAIPSCIIEHPTNTNKDSKYVQDPDGYLIEIISS